MTRQQASLSKMLIRRGFSKGNLVKLYNEEFELVSNPFVMGDALVFVDGIGRKSGQLRRVRIPLTIVNKAKQAIGQLPLLFLIFGFVSSTAHRARAVDLSRLTQNERESIEVIARLRCAWAGQSLIAMRLEAAEAAARFSPPVSPEGWGQN